MLDLIISIPLLALAFTWLGLESHWLTIRLPVGSMDYGKLWLDTFSLSLESFTASQDYSEHHLPDGYSIRHCLKGVAKTNGHYEILLSPSVEPMCGIDWLNAHWNDLAEYRPQIALNMAGVRYQMTVNKLDVIKEIMRVNHVTRKQKLAYC